MPSGTKDTRDKPKAEFPSEPALKLLRTRHPPQDLTQRSSLGVKGWEERCDTYLRAMGL